MNIQDAIINSIKGSFGFRLSEDGKIVTIERLCNSLPEITRGDIINTLGKMKGIDIIDAMTGAIKIPKKYFE